MSPSKPLTIAVLTDFHYGTTSPIAARRSDIADLLLSRAVRRLNRLAHPDVTLVLGDLLDDGTSSGAKDNLLDLRTILDRLASPYLAIPGNHDGDPEAFYEVFDRPHEIEEISIARFLPFIDREAPGFNAQRSAVDIARLQRARHDYNGPIVALQHVCLFPPERALAPYNYTNAGEIVTAMQAAGVTLSISGHHHEGAATTRDRGITYVHAPALCETPFTLMIITLDNDKVTTQRHTLVQPETACIVDTHVHTQLAYCAEDVNVEGALSLASDVGLGGVGFAEHAGQLYFDRQTYWSRVCLRDGIETAHEHDNRMDDYLALKRAYAGERRWFGLEVGCDHHGNLLLKPADRLKVDYLIGSIHSMPGLIQDAAPNQHVHETFLLMTESILTSGVAALAHPFRIFRRSGWAPPPALFLPVAQMLRDHSVAAELNFHTNEPPLDFVRLCLDCGVRFTFGSDAHRLDEVGDFAYQLALLNEAGFDGELADVLAPIALIK